MSAPPPQTQPQKTFSPNPRSINSIQPTCVCLRTSPNLVFQSFILALFISLVILAVPESGRILFDGGELAEPLMQRQLFLEWLTDFHHNEYVQGVSVLLEAAPVILEACHPEKPLAAPQEEVQTQA